MNAKQIISELENMPEQQVNIEKINALKQSDGLHAFLLSLAGYWGVIRLALQFVKLFTGKKADAKIDEVIKWGDENIK